MEHSTCSVGQLTASECHKETFCHKKGIKNVDCLSEEEKVLLSLRTETELDSIQTICFHHESLFLKKFELRYKTCSDPLKKHKEPIKKSLYPVTLQQSKCLESGLRTEEESSLQREEAIEKLNVSLNKMECSPLKLHGVGETSKRPYGKRKIESLQKKIEDNFSKMLNIDVSPTVRETEK